MITTEMEVKNACTDEYPTPETFERWRQSVKNTDSKIKSGEITVKSIREQFADHGFIFD